MNVLQITQTADTGGAEVCARMLHERLLDAGHDARVLVGHTTRADDDRIQVMQRQSPLSRLLYHGLNLLGLNYLGILNANAILQHPAFLGADVVHLHNIHGGYFNYVNLIRLSARKPVVWTLHDMWALTGHCAHSFDCRRWQTGCGRCPYPKTYPPIRMDTTRLACKLKRWVYERSDLSVICPSRWIMELVEQSRLARFPVHHIPNGVDTQVYRPRERGLCRSALGIPPDKRVILAAVPGLGNPFKDQALLRPALDSLNPELKAKSVLVTMGWDEPEGGHWAGLPLVRLGYLENDEHKAAAYSAADVFLHPTKADNQPLAVLEAMACGCPVVSSNVGGVPEMVKNNTTGCLVDMGDAEAFGQGVARVLSDEGRRQRMSAQSRQFVLDHHCLNHHVANTLEVYNKTILAWKEKHTHA